MATITDVAKLAGVSISTVSHVINGTKYVGDELTARVKDAIRELDFQANDIAVSMKKKETKNIGVILPNIGMIFFPDVLAGIETAARENGYKLLYFSSNYQFEQEKEYLQLLKKSWVDGIVIDSCCSREDIETYQKELIADVSGKFVPVVALETPFTAKELGVITLDEENYAYKAIKYLLGIGRRNIGLLMGPEYLPVHEEVLKGYRKACAEFDVTPAEDTILYGDYFAESGYHMVLKALQQGAKWDALYVVNDQMAIGAIKAIKEFGLSIPQDIAIIGADGVFITTLVEPSLTTVDLPRYDMGYQAVKMLVDMIQNHRTTGDHIQMEGKLIIRQSTDATVPTDWDLKGW